MSIIFGVDSSSTFNLNEQHVAVQHADVLPFLNEALSLFESQYDLEAQEFFASDVDLGRIIGLSSCVPTAPGDEVFFARRTGRRWDSRLVYNKAPVPTSFVTIALRRRGPRNYDVLTAYIGRHAPREVGDRSLRWASPEDRAKSEHFWGNHALIAELQQF